MNQSAFKTDHRENKGKSHHSYWIGNRGKSWASSDGNDLFCYCCDKDGHVATQCAAPKDFSKVIQKLILSLKKVSNKCQTNQDKVSPTTNSFFKQSAVGARDTTTLPKGLVGKPSLGNVIIEHNPVGLEMPLMLLPCLFSISSRSSSHTVLSKKRVIQHAGFR